ncbi:hypothetical protein CP981_18750 [Streptomyces platensis]|uniref:Uncharacterized protein n=1 Tax=Streptomyces platensis TaxID=58346 RepID=A0AAE6NHZ2_STRPT|nr:hypothetical protein CP981_18750 [Streptomyces platensis]
MRHSRISIFAVPAVLSLALGLWGITREHSMWRDEAATWPWLSWRFSRSSSACVPNRAASTTYSPRQQRSATSATLLPAFKGSSSDRSRLEEATVCRPAVLSLPLDGECARLHFGQAAAKG